MEIRSMGGWCLMLGLLAAAVSAAESGCPHFCRCYMDSDGYQTANCTTATFSVRSTDLSEPKVDALNVRPHHYGHAFKLFPRMFKSFKNVKFLNLSNSSISTLPDEVFSGLNYVIEIDMSYNKIKHLNGVVFKYLNNLSSLLLRGNPLFLNSFNAIVSKSLRELDMGECSLRVLPTQIFSGVGGLTHLSLDGNELQTVTYHVLPTGLRYLNLARNRIVNVPNDVLVSITHLKRLDLSDNPINCTCDLLLMQDYFSGRGITFETDVICTLPLQYAGQRLNKINEDELCKSEILNKERHINHIKYPTFYHHESKRYRQHNIIDDLPQADQPAEATEDSEVMFENSETVAMGTHMENTDHDQGTSPEETSTLHEEVDSTENDKKVDDYETEGEELLTDPNPDEEITENEESSNMSGNDKEYSATEKMSNDDSNTETSKLEELDTSTGTVEEIRSGSPEIVDHEFTNADNSTFAVTSRESLDDDPYEIGENFESSIETTSEHPINHESTEDYTAETISPLSITSSEETFGKLVAGNTSAEDDVTTEYGTTEQSEVSEEMLSELTTILPPYETTISSDSDETSPVPGETTTEKINTDTSTEASQNYTDYETDETTIEYLTNVYENYTAVTEENLSLENESYTPSTESSLEVTSASTTQSDDDYSLYTTWPTTNNTDTEEDTDVYSLYESLNTTDNSTETTTDALIPLISESGEDYWTPQITTESTTEDSTETTTEEVTSSTVPINLEFDGDSKEDETTSHRDTVSTTISTPKESDETTVADIVVPIVEEDESTTTEVEPVLVAETIGDLNTSKEEYKDTGETKEASAYEGIGSYIVVSAIAVLVVGLIVLALCKRKKSPNKIRLPNDAESNLGTEMQDMDSLLPKPPENGVKIVPKDYGEPNGEVKEEAVPMVQREPEVEEKNELNGGVQRATARLTILPESIPQTPVFIHKPYTD